MAGTAGFSAQWEPQAVVLSQVHAAWWQLPWSGSPTLEQTFSLCRPSSRRSPPLAFTRHPPLPPPLPAAHHSLATAPRVRMECNAAAWPSHRCPTRPRPPATCRSPCPSLSGSHRSEHTHTTIIIPPLGRAWVGLAASEVGAARVCRGSAVVGWRESAAAQWCEGCTHCTWVLPRAARLLLRGLQVPDETERERPRGAACICLRLRLRRLFRYVIEEQAPWQRTARFCSRAARLPSPSPRSPSPPPQYHTY